MGHPPYPRPEAAEAGLRLALSGEFAFQLYDTFGFPLDLTELMARERGLTVDVEGFERLMEEQRARARAAQKRQIITLSEVETKESTRFIGYESLTADAKVLEVVSLGDRTAVVLDVSAAYAEMGGQVGDTGELVFGGEIYHIANTQKAGNTFLHFLDGPEAPVVGSTTRLIVDRPRRRAIERHHTVTHIFHWALHEVVSKEAAQKGSYVGPDKLTFDFNSPALTHAQIADIEKLVNERIVTNDPVSWTDIPFAEAKANPNMVQLFGEKVRRPCARRSDRRRPARAGWLEHGVVWRNAHASHRRDRPVPVRQRRRGRGRRPPGRGDCRARSVHGSAR